MTMIATSSPWDNSGNEMGAYATRLVDESIRELELMPEEEQVVRLEFLVTLQKYLPQIIKGLMLIASFVVYAKRDIHYFQKRRIRGSEPKDCAQGLSEKILKQFFGTWPTGNIRHWRSRVREWYSIDLLRKAKREFKYWEQATDFDSYPDKCNPLLDHDEWTNVSINLSEVESKVVAYLASGTRWQEIALRVGISESEVEQIAYRIFESGESPSRRRSRLKKRST